MVQWQPDATKENSAHCAQRGTANTANAANTSKHCANVLSAFMVYDSLFPLSSTSGAMKHGDPMVVRARLCLLNFFAVSRSPIAHESTCPLELNVTNILSHFKSANRVRKVPIFGLAHQPDAHRWQWCITYLCE